jgi:hypothetical protein
MKTRTIKTFWAVLASTAAMVMFVSAARAANVSFSNQHFIVVSRGLAVAICDTFDSNIFAVAMPTLPIHIENGIATYQLASIESGGFFSRCDRMDSDPLQLGEVVMATGSKVHGREFRLRIVSAPHTIHRGIGAFKHTVYESGAAELRFKLRDPRDPEQVQAAVRQWLEPTDKTGGNTASGVEVPEIREGMTPSEVEGVLGPPDLKFLSGAATTYTYKSSGLSVVFVDGKVAREGDERNEAPTASVPTGPQPQVAQDRQKEWQRQYRKAFVIEFNKRSAIANDSNVHASADGTRFVVHSPRASKERGRLLFDEHLIYALQIGGFTKFVYTNDADKTFQWDVKPISK